MSIRKRSRYGPRRNLAGRRGTALWRPAFTLIELLVVVAIIALLISILLPSLSSAREQARAVVCGQHLRQFGNGLQVYAGENRDWIPGTNTSGVAIRAKKLIWSDVSVLCQSKLPVQSFDWLTPILASSMELPASRAERFKFILSKYRCPSQMYPTHIWEFSVAPDLSQFSPQAPWPAVSYLMSVHFQYFGQNNRRIVGYYEHATVSPPIWSEQANPKWEVLVNDFLPLLSRLSSPARKIFAADATRYVADSTLIDIDVTPVPDWFGCFTTAGGWWRGDQAYGVRPGSPNWDGMTSSVGSESGGQNLTVSYRHGMQRGVLSGSARDNGGAINAVFFDGHVERLTDRRSREPHLWYPSGAVVKKREEGMTSLPNEFVIP
jgi:prepilin-type N-terminal cleavage/methylation domain-containing protein/prepilin-type processing-associated H-X9-DG protein